MTTPTTTQECNACGGDRPRDPDAWGEYLTDEGGYCPGHLAVDSTGRVVGCGAWDADVYDLQDGPATPKTETIEITARARFFSHHPIEERQVLIDDDDTIRVWDDVAGHYTVCHALAQSAERRILKLARSMTRSDA